MGIASVVRRMSVKEWSPRHSIILKEYLDGITPIQIAAKMNILHADVVRIINSPLFIEKAKRVEGKVIDQIVQSRTDVQELKTVQKAIELLTREALRATEQLIDLAMNPNAKSKVQLTAIIEVLDRAGVRVPTTIISRTFEKTYSPEEVVHAKGVIEESQAILERLSTTSSAFILPKGDGGQAKEVAPSGPSSSISSS